VHCYFCCLLSACLFASCIVKLNLILYVMFKVIVCVKDQSETSRMMSHSARRLNQLGRVSVVVRTVTGLVSVEVVKVMVSFKQIIFQLNLFSIYKLYVQIHNNNMHVSHVHHSLSLCALYICCA